MQTLIRKYIIHGVSNNCSKTNATSSKTKTNQISTTHGSEIAAHEKVIHS